MNLFIPSIIGLVFLCFIIAFLITFLIIKKDTPKGNIYNSDNVSSIEVLLKIKDNTEKIKQNSSILVNILLFWLIALCICLAIFLISFLNTFQSI